jgi:outer membrane lipoprotein-sorting protein
MKSSVRWLVPGSVMALVAVGALAPGASADLPAKTPREVLVMAAEADVDAFSGTVVARTDLGIPTALLGGMGGEPGMGGSGLGEEERTVRVWKDGDTLARASVASLMGEKTLIRNGDDLWYYDSSTSTLTTGEVPEHDGTDKPDAPWDGDVPDPAEAAQWLLDAVEPTTEVTAGDPTVVAGREAYEVVLTPQQDGTLIGEASMAVDAQTGAVLRVQVTAVGASSPAIDVGYTTFDPSAPPADVFALGTPPGATVEQLEPMGDKHGGGGDKASYQGVEPDVSVVGEGWTSVVVLPADLMTPPAGSGEPGDDPLAMLPPELLSPVDGGSVLTTALLSVMLADDGRVLVGAVTPEVLAAAAE